MPTITQAGVVTSSQTNVAASSYSFVGGFTTHFSGAVAHTINVTTHAVGNLLVSVPVVFASVVASVITFTAPTGANVTGFVDSGQGTQAYPNTTATLSAGATSLWLGRASAVGAFTLTVPYTFSAGVVNGACLNVLEFTCPGVDAGAVWSVDASGKAGLTPPTSTLSYPFLAPTPTAFSPEIYVGNVMSVDLTLGAGSTPGFSYTGTQADLGIQAFSTNTTTPIAPSATCQAANANGYGEIAALIKATISKAIFDNIRITLQPVPTGRMWIISQIGFEFLPANTLQTMTANIVLNGRVIKPGINPNAGQFQGPPYITVRAGDTMWVDLFNVPVGASAVANFLYNEYSAYATAHELGGVV